MQSPPLRRGVPAQGAEAFNFETKLENEESTLDAIITSMARGALPVGAWERLHAAAQRDGRTSELAFAFEGASQGKRVKALAPGLAAEFFFQAACFFSDVLGDDVAALTYLERALALVPAHPASFGKIEQLLLKNDQRKRLADLYATAAQHRTRAEQPVLLRRAAELLSQAGGADDKVIELLQHALRLEPGDEQTRAELEALCIKANRLRDVVRLNEQALAAEPPPDEATRKRLLSRILELYADRLHEPERAMPHVEQLLALDPESEQGRRVAQKLVVVKGLAGRAAAALANACEVVGTPDEIARYVAIELENTRGPKRATLLARLGRLKAERLGDEAGAFDALEQALAIDASDDDLRAAYVALARKLGRHAEAAKTLARVLATVKSPAVKARAGAELGEMQLRSGDVKRAKASLAAALGGADAPADAQLAAAYALSEIHEAEKDARALSEVLERIAALEPDKDRAREVDERLADLASKLGDRARAIAAYERLLSTSARVQALAALAPLYEAGGDPEKHARLLEEQAKDMADPHDARTRMMRAAEVRVRATSDAEAAIGSCRAILDRFGPARDVLALLVPLLEAQRRWRELERAIVDEAALTSGPEHAQVMARLGALRMQRLGDGAGAIEALGEALAFDPGDKTARLMLEKLMAAGDHRLAAARVLEPVYRRQGVSGSLLKVLELRGTLEPDVDERLSALRGAAELADGAEAGRAAEVVGRALADAVAYHRALGEWLDRLDAVAAPGSDAKRAAVLGKAIGDREVTSDDLSALAKRAAEAHAAAGEVAAAIALFRRVLSFEPHSTELLSRIDDLLRDQGSPIERVALYRAALARGGSSRRRELLHRIGAIERHDLGDAAAAIETYRAALEEDADDPDAQTALGELYAQAERWDDLCAFLEARLTRLGGEAARATRATLAAVAAAHGDEARARTHSARLLEEPELAAEHLDAVARAAEALSDPDLERAVLQRRAQTAEDPREQIAWLDRMGELDERRRGDLEAAASAWRRAGELAEAGGDDEAARKLYWRARRVAPEDREVTARLAALCERGQIWEELPPLYAALGEQSADDAERVELWLRTARVLSERLGDLAGAADRARRAFELAPTRPDVLSTFEELSIAALAVDGLERAIEDALAHLERTGGLEADPRARLLLARARSLASDPRRMDDAKGAYRAILDDSAVGQSQIPAALAAFEALVAQGPESPQRQADRRWLLEWRVQHAPEEERAARRLDWAREEEAALADPVHALGLYRKVLEADPDCDEALSAVTRLALATGDIEQALSALGARREQADGPSRVAIELQIAEVLLSHTNRSQEALASLRAVLSEVPNDPVARSLSGRLLTDRATRADAIRMLEQACDATDDSAARTEILGGLLDTPTDGEDTQARRTWFERLCDLEREEGNLQAAMRTAVRAAREIPDVPELWDRAESVARALSRPEEMAALYEQVLARPLTSAQARTIGERAVQFSEEWFEDSAGVVRVLERVLDLDPTADWAFDRLKLLLDAAERWDDLFALYDRTLESATGRARAMLLEDAAQTAKDFADRPDRAIHYLELLRSLKPGDAKLTGALERLYERQGRHRELVDLLGERLPALQGEDARRTRARIAVLWLEGLGDAAAAFDVIEPVIEGAGESPVGTTPSVWTLLERILAAVPPPPPEPRRSSAPPARKSERPPRSKRGRKSEAPSTPPASIRQKAAARLREHYAQLGRDADLVRMLLVELEAVKTDRERVRRHLQIAESYEKLGEPASALEQVGLAVVIDPQDEAKRAKLAELAESTNRLERLADLLTAAAETADDTALGISLTMQAAAVRADRAADAPGAIALLSSVLTMPDLRSEDALAAGRKLEPLLEAAGREAERLDVLERIAAVDPDGGAQRNALGRAADLAARLEQNDRAIALWEKRVAADPTDAEALDGLVTLLERVRRSDRLAEILELRARAATDDERRRADRVRVATLLGDVLDRKTDAIVAWHDIERAFGEADDVALALAALLRSAQRWQELAALLDRHAARTSGDTERAEILRQLGDVHRQELRAYRAAIDTYARALAANSRNAEARAGLLLLADETSEPDLRAPAVAALLGALRASDDWQGVLELLPQRLLAADSDAGKLAVLLEAAHISEQRAFDPAKAFEAMRQAFVIAPGDEGVEREVTRLAETSAAWARLVEAYREAIGGAARTDQALLARLRTNLGATLETRLDDPRGALAEYLQVVRDTSDLGAGGAALRVAGRLAEWDVAARVVVDVAQAWGAASQELLDAYGEAAAASGGWDEATRALTAATSSAGLGGSAARDIEARVAQWHRDRRGDPDAAQAALERALAHDDSETKWLVMLVELQRRQRARPLVDSLLRLSRATGGDWSLLREAAEVAYDPVHDLPLARAIETDLLALARTRWEAHRAAAPADGGDGGEPPATPAPSYAEWAIEGLARLHEEEGDLRPLVDVLMQGDGLPFALEVRRGMRRRAARIALDRLADTELAITLYLALFSEDPHDEEAAERLAVTYAAHGRTRELLDLRERQIAAAEEMAVRTPLRLEAARLLVDLGESGRAAEMLGANLAEDARHEKTVEALAAVLDAGGRTGELRDLLVDQAERAEATTDGARAAHLFWRAAVLAEEQLRDPGAAEAYHTRVTVHEPRPASLDALGRLATARGDHGAAAGWLERLLEVLEVDRVGGDSVAGDPASASSRRIEATLRLADALVGAGETTRATERLAQALVQMPQAESVRDRLATLYRDQADWSRLAMLTADAAAHAPDKATRMARLREAAALFSARCGQPELAVPLLEQATDLAPEDQPAALALADALAGSGRFDDARSLLKSMVDAFGGRRPKERAPVHYQIARLELAMGNRARALVELDTAARVDPQNADILRSLAELARDDGQLERAEKSYRALLVVLRRRDEGERAHNVARSEVLLELSSIAERQGQGARAQEILESALEAAESGDFEQERLESALRARGDFERLVRVLEAKLERMGDSPAAAKPLTELAELLGGRLGQHERALAARLRAVALDPGSQAVHEDALTLARTRDAGVRRYVDAVGVLVDRSIERGDTQLACSLLIRLGQVAEVDLGDDPRAAALYERAVDLGTRATDVLKALDRVFDRMGDARKQGDVLSMRIEVETRDGGPRAASDATYRLAALRLSSRDTFDEGAEMMQAALDLDPQLGRAEEALRRAIAIDPTHSRTLELYERIGRHPGHERALVDALRVRAELPGADANAMREAVEIAVRIGEVGQAESLLARVIERERAKNDNAATLAWALDARADLRHAAGDVEETVELKRAAAAIADPEVARKLTFEVARIATEELGDWSLAAEQYEALPRSRPADRSAWEPLAVVYKQKGDIRKLGELLASVVDCIDDPSLRARLRLDRVRALQELGLADAEAAPLLREIVHEDASQVEAALMLAAILERAGARGELIELLARQMDSAKDRGDSASIASLSLRLGALLESTDCSKARDVYYTGLEWEAKSRELLDALLRLLHGQGSAEERADVLERRLAVEHGPAAESMTLELWAARMHLGDEAGAERSLEVGFRAYPASAMLRDRLETALRARNDWRKLAELCILDAGARTDTGGRVGRLREAAAILGTNLKDARGAADVLREARAVATARGGAAADIAAALLRDHVEMLLEAGDPAAAVSELSAALDALSSDDPRRAELFAARAYLRSATGDEDAALGDLEAAFAVDPAPFAEALVTQIERVCARAAEAGDATAVRALRLRLAQALPHADAADRARAILGELLREDPKDCAALRALASIEEGLERWDAASAALKRLVGLEEAEGTVETALRLADACERAGRPSDARGALERARIVAPLDRAVRERLERLYEQTGDWHELADLVLADARASGDVADRFRLLLRAGALLLERAADPLAGCEALEEARALRPTDPECVALLADAYTLCGRAEEAVALLEPLIAPHKGRRARELAPLHWRLARAARALGNAAEEVRALLQSLECDAQNGQVCWDVALRAMEIDQLDLASRALRAITLLKSPGPMSKALAYQHMGEIARRQGDGKRALMLLSRALTEDPSLEGARALALTIERDM
jgi:golgin subfamily B member 1